MVLYIIGLGLHDEKDISVKGLEIVKRCEFIYLESYTSALSCPIEKLEELYEKKIIIADRNLIETKIESEILLKAKEKNIALLIIGDPFAATTHTDIRLRAKELNIEVKIIHNASVITAVGIIGLELYKYGKITSIPFNNENIITPITVFNKNKELGLHTLFLLDLEPLKRKFMTVSEASSYLIKKGIDENIISIGCGGLGSFEPQIKVRSLKEMSLEPITRYPQCLIIPGKLHFMEEEALSFYK
jgi:diphthine synthase